MAYLWGEQLLFGQTKEMEKCEKRAFRDGALQMDWWAEGPAGSLPKGRFYPQEAVAGVGRTKDQAVARKTTSENDPAREWDCKAERLILAEGICCSSLISSFTGWNMPSNFCCYAMQLYTLWNYCHTLPTGNAAFCIRVKLESHGLLLEWLGIMECY